MIKKAAFPIIFILLFSCKSKDPCDNMTSGNVCVTIINQSGQDTKRLTLKNEDGTKEIGIVKNNSQTSIIYKSEGEDSYTLTAILQNGDTLKSNCGYTEGGYRIIEKITKDSVETEYSSFKNNYP